eukprot:11207143-Alexandrium_andersonii.AAC.1
MTVRNGATLRDPPQIDLVPVETFMLEMHHRVLESVDLFLRRQAVAEVATAVLTITEPKAK